MPFIDQLEDSSEITTGVKVQVWGASATGKSHDAYENLPRPLVVVDSDVAAGLFADDRFEGFKRLGPDRIPDVDTLIAFLEEFVSDPRWYRTYRSLLIDSLTNLVDAKVAQLGIDQSSESRDGGKGQIDFARAAKTLNRLLRRVSALGVHVYVTAEERTKYVGGRPAEGDDRNKSSLSPTKFTHAFDLIIQKLGEKEVVVHKSRYRKWRKGQRLGSYQAHRDLLPILLGREQKSAGLENFDPATPAHEALMDLLRELGSTAKPGGRIPVSEMRQLIATAMDNDLAESSVRTIMAEVRGKYGAGQAEAA
ncbi:MAG TPA: AAA family ATPase [Gemmatimonadaceae bacterium]|nr:AAA family ATPase [Gemmatimonadaceae bacterium]